VSRWRRPRRFSFAPGHRGRYLVPVLSGGVMVAQESLELFVMVRIHAGQPVLLNGLRAESRPHPLNVVEVLNKQRQYGHQKAVMLVSQPRRLNLSSRSSFLQQGHIGHSSSLASVYVSLAAIVCGHHLRIVRRSGLLQIGVTLGICDGPLLPGDCKVHSEARQRALEPRRRNQGHSRPWPTFSGPAIGVR
jgi:hypothetical protein